MSDMLKELAQAKDEAKHTAATGEGGNPNGEEIELPKQASPDETREAAPEAQAEAPEETPATAEGSAEPIRINGQLFTSQREAFAYAEQLAREKELTDAHAMGIREALEATRAPQQPEPEPEDDFEQRFYSNPKEALKEVEQRAINTALGQIKAEQQREKLWTEFLNDNPDIRRKDAERILQENWDVIGRMTDLKKAQATLAQKVRSEYEEIIQTAKPRTVLGSTKQVQSPSGGAPKGVTPKKDEKPLGMAAQMRLAYKR
jgi:hypothetical protein